MTVLRPLLFLFVMSWLAVPAMAQDLTLRNCTDASGHVVPSRMNLDIPVVVATQIGRGAPSIVFNPRVLPDLSESARAFLYAHECARHSLGIAREARTVENAHQADCAGLAALQRSGMLRGAQAVSSLQSALVFSPEQWRQVPGPARGFSLANCAPPRAMPASDPAWNRCVQRCGDGLFRCGRSSVCLQSYDRCEAACGR